MREPVWIREDVVLAVHSRQLAEHGGIPGLRDASLLDSALNAPKQFFHYEQADIVNLAAAYAFSLSSNHPFADGNKRTAYVCMLLFLKLNGLDIDAEKSEKAEIMLKLAAGEINREQLALWIKNHLVVII